jgi:MFS family permease
MSMPSPHSSPDGPPGQPIVLSRLPASIWALGFVSLLMDVSSEMVHSLLPLFMVGSLGVSVAVVGLIEGLAEATALITKVFSGVISDYVGKRKVLAVIGYGLGALTKPLFALATGPGLIFSARMLDRVGKGIRGAPQRRSGRRYHAARAAGRRIRPAPGARHGRGLRRPFDGGGPDVVVGQ